VDGGTIGEVVNSGLGTCSGVMGERTGSPGGLSGYVRVSVPGEDGGEGGSRGRGESGSDMVIILRMMMEVCW
jgi:hypothetical protein